MIRSPARSVAQLGAALALACLGLGASTHPASAAGTAVIFESQANCGTTCSWGNPPTHFHPQYPVTGELQAQLGNTITYHIQLQTDLAIFQYQNATLTSIPHGTFAGCWPTTPSLPCVSQNPVTWSSTSLQGTGFVYDLFYEITVTCSEQSFNTNAQLTWGTGPYYAFYSNSEYAQVTGCSTSTPTPNPGSTSVATQWSNPGHVGVGQGFTGTVKSQGNPVTSGTLSFGYGSSGCSGVQTPMGNTPLNSAGSGTVYFAFGAPGTYVISVSYVPPSGSTQYLPSCSSASLTVNSFGTPTPTPPPAPTPPGSAPISTNVSVAWGNPISAGVAQTYSGTVTAQGSPVTVGTVWFGYGGVPCGNGVNNLGGASVNSHGTASINYSFPNAGSYVISVGYQPPDGSLFLWSCASSGLTVSAAGTFVPTPPPSGNSTPIPFPTATPNNLPTPSGLSFFAPSSPLPATGGTPAPTVASAPPVVAGTAVVLAAAPPRPLPELQVLNAGSVLALQALNAGPLIAAMDVIAVLGLVWHFRRKLASTDDD